MGNSLSRFAHPIISLVEIYYSLTDSTRRLRRLFANLRPSHLQLGRRRQHIVSADQVSNLERRTSLTQPLVPNTSNRQTEEITSRTRAEGIQDDGEEGEEEEEEKSFNSRNHSH
jgi:hypothetical protein